MKTKTLPQIKTVIVACLAHLMAGSVVLAHAHAGDVVRPPVRDTSAQVTKASTDMNAKVIGDLHNHIDKTTLKTVMKASTDATTANRRSLSATLTESEASILEQLSEELLFLRIALTLRASTLL